MSGFDFKLSNEAAARVTAILVRGFEDAVAMEREGCAALVESFDLKVVDPLGRTHPATGLEVLAAAIRARGGK